MKKIVLGLAATALIFASCAKDEVTSVNKSNPNVIGFETSTGKTRATSATLATLQDDTDGFGVFATNASPAVAFIANQGYVWNGGANAWEWSGTDQMWPTADAGYPVNFYAYYPKTSIPSGLDATNLKASHTIAAVASQEDLLAANQLNVVARPSSSKVNLDFEHMLSKIDFKVVTGANVTVEVQSVGVKSVYNTRTFDYTSLAWTGVNATGNDSYAYLTATETSNNFVGAITAAPVTNTNGSLMLMPQNLASKAWDLAGGSAPGINESYIEVVYRVTETASGDDITGFENATEHPQYTTIGSDVTGNLFVKVGYPLSTDWANGYAYTYIIYLGKADSSGGNLVEENFIDEDGEETDLPVVDPGTGDEKEIPDPIVDLDAPIGFLVDVKVWAPAVEGHLQ